MTKLIEEQGSKVPKPSPRRPSGQSPKTSKTNDQPQLFAPTDIIEHANHWVGVLAPRLKATTGFDIPDGFVVQMGDQQKMDERGALAWARPGYIELNPSGVQGMTDEQLGALMAHEMTHQVMQGASLMGDREEGSYMLFTEGLADYIKDRIFQRDNRKESWNSSISGFSQVDPVLSPKEGYQTGAAFFQWLEAKKPGSVKAVIASLKSGSDTPLVDTVGAPLRDLLKQYASETEVTPQDVEHSKEIYHRKMAATNQRSNEVYQQYLHGEASISDVIDAYRAGYNIPAPLYSFQVGSPQGPAPAPPRLGPHYAAGPNPGLSAIYHPENDPSTGVPGIVDIPSDLYGMEPLPMSAPTSDMAASAASVPAPAYQQGKGPEALPWGEAAQVNDSVGLFPPDTEQNDFTPQGDAEQFLFSPTDRVAEPATAGLPYGDGPNYSPHVDESDDELVRRVAIQAKNDPNAPKQMRQFAERALNGM